MKRINLLPQEERVKASRERGLIWAILILVAVVVVLGLVYMKYNSEVGTKQDELAAVQAQTAEVQTQIAALSPYAVLEAQRTAMTATAKGIYESSVPFSTCSRSSVWSSPRTCVCRRSSPRSPPACCRACLPQPAAATDVTFTGQTENHRDVAEFMTSLGLIPQLMSITLGSSTDVNSATSTSEGTTTTTNVKQFTVTARPSSVHDETPDHHSSGGGAMRARGREIYIITAVVAVVLIVAWYFLLFSPTQQKLSDLDGQVAVGAERAVGRAAGGRQARGLQEDGAAVSRRDRPPRQDAPGERGHPRAHHRALQDG